MGFKYLKTLSKSSKKAVIALPVIVFGTVVLVIALSLVWPPGIENDIPNWITMIVELGVGAFIAAFLYIIQGKTADALREYNEEQKRLQTSIRHRSFEIIEGHLSTAAGLVEYDKRTIEDEKDITQQRIIVERFLRSPYDRPSNFRLQIIDQLQKESTFVRPYVAKTELGDSLSNVVEKMQMLYGLSSKPAPGQEVAIWYGLCDTVLFQIGRAKEVVQQLRAAEDDRTSDKN